MKSSTRLYLLGYVLALGGCAKQGSSGSSYTFAAAAKIKLATGATLAASAFDDAVDGVMNGFSHMINFVKSDFQPLDSRSVNPCNNHPCFTPTALSGKFFGVGLLIQSSGNGLSAYFGKSAWSSITGTSETYDFVLGDDISHTGDLTCCNGTGDLSKPDSSYIESVSYLLGYVDATFRYTGSMNPDMNDNFHHVRFILADDVIAGAKRGDLMYYKILPDGSGTPTFEYYNADGTHSTIRPTDPITMNSAVVDYVNPFGTVGNQTIPVIYSGVVTATSDTEKITVTQTQLETVGRTYSFKFPSKDFIIFASLLGGQDDPTGNDLKLVYDVVTLLQRVHLQGLPHSVAILGGASDSVLDITEPTTPTP